MDIKDFEKKFDRFEAKLDDKLDRIEGRLGSIDQTLVRHEANLTEHMRRTSVAEKRLEHVTQQLEPIKAHVANWGGAGKVLVVTSGLGGLVLLGMKLMGLV